jgi:hypothetical protein
MEEKTFLVYCKSVGYSTMTVKAKDEAEAQEKAVCGDYEDVDHDYLNGEFEAVAVEEVKP